MADEPHLLRGIEWRETFSFTHLFRSFRIAIHPSKIFLGLVLLLLLYSGGRLLDGLWSLFGIHDGPGIFITFFGDQVRAVNSVVMSAAMLNIAGVVAGALDFVSRPIALFKNYPLFATLFLLWFLLLWSVFGGAIARIAAIHVARDEKISVRQALRFSTNKVLSYLFAPLIPLIILLALASLLALGGLLLYIPWGIGPIIVGALLILGLLAGFVMTLVLLGTVGGFNLMYPTVAVEGSDSFDAISRSFSYVFARPWRTAWYTLVAVVYGAITYLFVRLFIFLMLMLTHQAIGWWIGHSPAAFWHGTNVNGVNSQGVSIWPMQRGYDDPLVYDIPYNRLRTTEDIAATLIAFWHYLTVAALGAYAISFYFSSNTIIYGLLRREVDATELDDVYVEQTDEDFTDTTPVTAETKPTDTPAAATLSTTAEAPATPASSPSPSTTGTGAPSPDATTETTSQPPPQSDPGNPPPQSV